MNVAIPAFVLAALFTIPTLAQEPDAVLSIPVPGGQSIQTAPELLIVIAKDTLDPADYEAVRRSIASIYKANHGNVTITLGIMRNGAGLDVAGPFRSALELQAVLRKTTPDSDPSAAPGPADFFTGLTATLNAIPSAWGSALLIGRMPRFEDGIDPAVPQYASAWLIRKWIAMKRTLLLFDPSGQEPAPWIGSIAACTGGAVLRSAEDIDPLIAPRQLAAVRWEHSLLTRGFDVNTVRVPGFAAPSITTPGQSALPDIAVYIAMRALIRDGSPASLAKALEINPSDRDAVRLGIDLADRSHDAATEIALLETSVELTPKDAKLWQKLGDLQFREKDFHNAEASLLQAHETGTPTASVSEELGRILFDKGDLTHALEYIEESLRLDPSQQLLWFFSAAIAKGLAKADIQIDSLEHGLALGGIHIPSRVEVIELLLHKGDMQDAARHADAELPHLPVSDADAQTTWAVFYERLARPDDALNCWKKAVTADPKREPAHFGVASILLARNDYAGALDAADIGLEANAASGRLELLKTTSLEKVDRIYDARRSLDSFALASADITILRRDAELKDVWGGDAAGAYRRYAEALIKSVGPKPEVAPVLERGRRLSLREQDMKAAAWFDAHLAGPVKSPVNIVITPAVRPTATLRFRAAWMRSPSSHAEERGAHRRHFSSITAVPCWPTWRLKNLSNRRFTGSRCRTISISSGACLRWP